MENDAASDQPPNPPATAADGAGAPENPGVPGLGEKIQRASDTAVDQHLAESAPKRGRGRPIIHGKYSARVSVENLGAGAAGASAEAASPVVYPLGYQLETPPFDEKSAAALVEVGISALNYLGAFLVRVVGGREIPDKEVIDRAVANCQVSEDAKRHLREGGLACARKYAVQMQYVAECQLGLGLGMWALAVTSQVKTLKAQGSALRPAE